MCVGGWDGEYRVLLFLHLHKHTKNFFVSSLAHIERLMSVNVCILMTVYLTKLVQIFNSEEKTSLYEKNLNT